MSEQTRNNKETTCRHCGEAIRLYPEGWIDCETHGSCATGANRNMPHQPRMVGLVDQITAAVRVADLDFERVGGSSRHWVRDCFLPEMEKAGLSIAEAAGASVPQEAAISRRVDRDVDLRMEMRAYLDTLVITGESIGEIRRSLFVPWDSSWNGWVRDDTAARERSRLTGEASSAPQGDK